MEMILSDLDLGLECFKLLQVSLFHLRRIGGEGSCMYVNSMYIHAGAEGETSYDG